MLAPRCGWERGGGGLTRPALSTEFHLLTLFGPVDTVLSPSGCSRKAELQRGHIEELLLRSCPVLSGRMESSYPESGHRLEMEIRAAICVCRPPADRMPFLWGKSLFKKWSLDWCGRGPPILWVFASVKACWLFSSEKEEGEERRRSYLPLKKHLERYLTKYVHIWKQIHKICYPYPKQPENNIH